MNLKSKNCTKKCIKTILKSISTQDYVFAGFSNYPWNYYACQLAQFLQWMMSECKTSCKIQ